MSYSVGERQGMMARVEVRNPMGSTSKRLVGLVAGALAFAAFATATPASAQEKAQKGIISIREVVIVGRVQKPVASLDVNKIQPKLTLAELRQPFLDRIEAAVTQEPF